MYRFPIIWMSANNADKNVHLNVLILQNKLMLFVHSCKRFYLALCFFFSFWNFSTVERAADLHRCDRKISPDIFSWYSSKTKMFKCTANKYKNPFNLMRELSMSWCFLWRLYLFCCRYNNNSVDVVAVGILLLLLLFCCF